MRHAGFRQFELNTAGEGTPGLCGKGIGGYSAANFVKRAKLHISVGIRAEIGSITCSTVSFFVDSADKEGGVAVPVDSGFFDLAVIETAVGGPFGGVYPRGGGLDGGFGAHCDLGFAFLIGFAANAAVLAHTGLARTRAVGAVPNVTGFAFLVIIQAKTNQVCISVYMFMCACV